MAYCMQCGFFGGVRQTMKDITYRDWANEYDKEVEAINNIITRKRRDWQLKYPNTPIAKYYDDIYIHMLVNIRTELQQIANILRRKEGINHADNSIYIV